MILTDFTASDCFNVRYVELHALRDSHIVLEAYWAVVGGQTAGGAYPPTSR